MTRGIIILTTVLFTTTSFSQEIETVGSSFSHEQSVKKINDVILKNKLKIFNQIDHHLGAKKVGLKLRPTTLILFGNPRVGTGFMQGDQKAGLDLPMKILIFTDGRNKTFVSYEKINKLTKKYNLKVNQKTILKINGVLAKIANSVKK